MCVTCFRNCAQFQHYMRIDRDTPVTYLFKFYFRTYWRFGEGGPADSWKRRISPRGGKERVCGGGTCVSIARAAYRSVSCSRSPILPCARAWTCSNSCVGNGRGHVQLAMSALDSVGEQLFHLKTAAEGKLRCAPTWPAYNYRNIMQFIGCSIDSNCNKFPLACMIAHGWRAEGCPSLPSIMQLLECDLCTMSACIRD